MSDRASPRIVPLATSQVRYVVPDGAREVVVTFEGADQTIARHDRNRPGFGERFLLENNYATVSVLTNSAHWFRDRDVQDYLRGPQLRCFLADFDRVHTYGSSMGGFAAIVFAEVLGASNVVAMQPVSSLRTDLVPWEERFVNGRKLDWSGAFADAAEVVGKCPSVWALYDPDNVDARHAERLAAAAPQMKLIHVKGAVHAVPRHLHKAGMLQQVVRACLKQVLADDVRGILKDAGL